MQGSAGAGRARGWHWGRRDTYKAFVFRQEDGDPGVDLADCERDEHGVDVWLESGWRRNVCWSSAPRS
jgi:hypothetical protein